MGTDIHCYIEYADPSYIGSDGKLIWHSFGSGNFGPRDYMLFNQLGTFSNNRGLPDDLGKEVRNVIMIPICYNGIEEHDDGNSYYPSFDRAISWLDYNSDIEVNENGFLDKVLDPDSHSHSYITADEFEEVINQIEAIIDIEYHVMISICRTYEKFGYKSRIVYWFDN